MMKEMHDINDLREKYVHPSVRPHARIYCPQDYTTSLAVKINIFRGMMPCHTVKRYQRFGGYC
jgi:hypothetical protein